MALQIKPTPTVDGESAKKFLKDTGKSIRKDVAKSKELGNIAKKVLKKANI